MQLIGSDLTTYPLAPGLQAGLALALRSEGAFWLVTQGQRGAVASPHSWAHCCILLQTLQTLQQERGRMLLVPDTLCPGFAGALLGSMSTGG